MNPRHGSTETPRTPDASMTLITEFYRRPLDAGYLEAAQRRQAGTEPRRTRRSVVGLVLVAVLLGLGTAAATQSLRRPASSAVEARQLLEAQIEQRAAEGDDVQAEITALTEQIATLQEQLLGDEGQPVRDQIAADSVQSGVPAVTGPGLRLVLTDAPSDDPDTEDPALRVQDVDLQVVVNGLWAAGAEAVAINGHRLTSMTAIRSAGDAVLVDLVALSSPYAVEAIGDSVDMQTQIARSSAGQHLATLRSTYGIGVQLTSQSMLELPGTGLVALHSAQVMDPAATSGAGAPPEGASQDGDVTGSAGPTGRDGT